MYILACQLRDMCWKMINRGSRPQKLPTLKLLLNCLGRERFNIIRDSVLAENEILGSLYLLRLRGVLLKNGGPQYVFSAEKKKTVLALIQRHWMSCATIEGDNCARPRYQPVRKKMSHASSRRATRVLLQDWNHLIHLGREREYCSFIIAHFI